MSMLTDIYGFEDLNSMRLSGFDDMEVRGAQQSSKSLQVCCYE